MSSPRVIITRPEPQAGQWQRQLQAMGYDARIASVMAIAPVSSAAAIARIKSTILDFDHYQKAVFVSRNAVREALHWLDAYWPQMPVGISYFAIGTSTARALEAEGLPVSALGEEHSAMNSETLLAHPSLQNVAGDKIVIFRGCGGRNLLRHTLAARGAQVDYCELYRRPVPARAPEALQNALVGINRQRDIITLHSGESVQNLATLIAEHSALASLRELTLLVPGERVAQIARQAGFSRLVIATNATDTAMLSALNAFCSGH